MSEQRTNLLTLKTMSEILSEKPRIELHLGDCLEIMKQIPDKSIDLVLTDPPYGLDIEYNSYVDTKENLKKLIDGFMPEILRIGKVVLFTCGIQNIGLYPQPYWVLIWTYKTTNTRGKWGFNMWQPILAYGKDPYLTNCMGARPDNIESTGLGAKVIGHPCPKPLKFWKQLLLRGSVKNTDTILDPFMGSGTTLVAAKELGRNAIGIEIEPKYYEIAKRRIEQSTTELFV